MRYLASLLVLFSFYSAFSQTDTLKNYTEGKRQVKYNSASALWYMSRHDLTRPVTLQTIRLKLDGTGDGTLRIFGQDGGSPYAELEKDLIEPIQFSKANSGVEFIDIELPDPVYLSGNQFFIVIDLAETSLYLMRSLETAEPTCTSGNGGSFYPTVIAVPGAHAYYKHLWNIVNYPLVVEAVVEPNAFGVENDLQDVTELNGLPTDMSIKSVAWADYNGDDFLDVLVAGRLFKNDPKGGKFSETTQALSLNGAARANTFIDMNNDGLLDILIFHTQNHLYLNNGDGSFSHSELDMPEFTSISSFSIGDVNNDGYPDLFVGQLWGKYPVPGNNYLFINDQKNGFIDETKRIYPDYDGEFNYPLNTACDPDVSTTWLSGGNRAKRSRGSQFVDFDNDGDLDLFVVNYFLEQDEFYENDGAGKFKDITSSKNIDKHSTGSNHGTGVDWADFDNDGDFDLLLSQFAHPWGKINFDHRGTTVYENKGAPNFEFEDLNPAGELGFDYEETHAGATWGDVNNDGLQDFVITTYYGCRYADIYLQSDSGTFYNASADYGIQNLVTGEDAIWVDYDNDGRLDLCLGENNQFKLLKNTGNLYHRRYLGITLENGNGNKLGVGAKVKVHANGNVYTQEVTMGRGQKMMKPLTLHFGLKDAKTINKVEVFWSDGSTDEYSNLAVNNHYFLSPNGKQRVSISKAEPDEIFQIFPNPTNSQIQLKSAFSIQKVAIYNIQQQMVDEKNATGNAIYNMSLQHLPNGIYFVHVYGNNQWQVQKVILNK
ncbi:MAG: VCBS repeat-containing protein [Bacteroidetes bacterium]|nr:VCBS repeat-containing protein [Bacteroidota bacterium]